ncbi:MAG: hypothetical protein ACTSYB_02625, partial [Candidatus Helarchaeota archaeon]
MISIAQQKLSLNTIETLLKEINPEVSSILNKILDGKNNLTQGDALKLFQTTGLDLQALLLTANFIRKQTKDD